jgi:hypothetical protein
MKKLFTILILIGALGTVASAFLKSFHFDVLNLLIVSEIIFLAGVILMPAMVWDKFPRFLLRQKIFVIVLWLGLMLTSCGSLLRLMRWDGYRYLVTPGFGLLLVYFVYIVVVMIADKLRIEPYGKQVSPEGLSTFGITNADLGRYVGVYTNKKLPLSITITQIGDTLVAQATGQSAYYLEVLGKNEFKYPKRDIGIEFAPEKNELTLKQHGGFFPFIKEG